MAQIIEITPSGRRIKEITKEELPFYAEFCGEAKKELTKDRLKTAATLQDEIDIIKEYLGLL